MRYRIGGPIGPPTTRVRWVGTGMAVVVATVAVAGLLACGGLPSPLSHSTAFVLDGAVYLLGGYIDNRLGAQVWRFDPRAGATTDAGVTLTAPRSDAAAVVINGVGYLVGGQGPDKQPVAAVTLVRPRRERWGPAARVRGSRSALFAGRIGQLHTGHA
jgi:hypothetical protein